MLDFEFEEEIEVNPEPTQPIQNMFDIASLKVKKEEKNKREKYFMKIMVNILAGLKIAKKMEEEN